MATWKPDPTFYPSPRMAMKAPAETLAYVASFDPKRQVPDGIAVVDVVGAVDSTAASKVLDVPNPRRSITLVGLVVTVLPTGSSAIVRAVALLARMTVPVVPDKFMPVPVTLGVGIGLPPVVTAPPTR